MVLKITRDELLMEWGVYGGYLLCPLYPLLVTCRYDLRMPIYGCADKLPSQSPSLKPVEKRKQQLQQKGVIIIITMTMVMSYYDDDDDDGIERL